MRVVSVANQKGGVGKTTVAVNLASALARLGRDVLLIDNDPQGHATAALGVEPAHFGLSTRDLYIDGGVKVQDLRIEITNGLHLVPADLDLSTVEQDLADEPRKLRRLLERLAISQMPYDVVLIDNPPQVGVLTFNALLASSEVLLPVDASRFSVEAVERFEATLRGLQQERGHRPQLRIVATGFDLRTRYARRVLEDIDALEPGRRVRTLIRPTIRLREAAQAGLPIDRFDPSSRVRGPRLDHPARRTARMGGAAARAGSAESGRALPRLLPPCPEGVCHRRLHRLVGGGHRPAAGGRWTLEGRGGHPARLLRVQVHRRRRVDPRSGEPRADPQHLRPVELGADRARAGRPMS